MHRAVTVAMVLALLAGSVPAAATLTQQSSSDTQPGASFAGVVGVQESEVNSEVASRSLSQRLQAADTNASKAAVVANESERLQQRLAELQAQKERLKQAYENGSISKGQYQARLAVLAAELRAVERRANQTAETAESLPEEALREKGANVSQVRSIAKQADSAGGGEVAEAARNIAGQGVGNGLGNAPNASERGPPDEADRGNDASNAGGRDTEDNATDGGPPADAGNASDGTADAGNASDAPDDAGNRTETGNGSDAAGDRGSANGTDRGDGATDGENATDTANRSAGNGDDSAGEGNGDAAGDGGDGGNGSENASDGSSNRSTNGSEQASLASRTLTDGSSGSRSLAHGDAFGALEPFGTFDGFDAVSRTVLS